MQRIADFELQYETLLKLLPANVQELVKSRQKDAASVEGDCEVTHDESMHPAVNLRLQVTEMWLARKIY